MKFLAAIWAKYGVTSRFPEIIALALLCATAAFYLWVLQPAEARLLALEQSLAGLKAASSAIPAQYRQGSKDAAAKLGAFYAFFERGDTFTDWLARLYDVAERAGVELQQGEYRQVDPEEALLTLREVTLPITGDYAKIRAFSEGVLNAVPVASLDRIAFRRQQATQSRVEAELRFTFYLPATDK